MLPLLLLGTTLQMGSTIMEGQAEKANNAYNAEIKRKNAATVRLQGNASEEALRRKTAQFLATQRVAMAQSGTDANSGSNADFHYQSEVNAELDAMTVRYESEMRAMGLLSEASQYDKASKEAMPGAYLGMAGQLLSGVGSYQSSNLAKLNGGGMMTAPMTQPNVTWRP